MSFTTMLLLIALICSLSGAALCILELIPLVPIQDTDMWTDNDDEYNE